jgi:hypothetical protein
MNRSLVRAAACTLAAAAVTTLLLAVPASTPSYAATFTFTDSSCSSFNWDGSNLTCVTSGGGGGGAISCSIALSNGSPTVSTPETLTANCSGYTGTVSYTWSGGGGGCPAIVQEGASPNKADVAAPGGSTALNCNYNLVASDNGTNTSSSPTKQISYTTGGGGGGGGGTINCNMPNGGATHVINATWGTSQLYYSVNVGGFGPNDAIVVKFTTSAVTGATSKGYVQTVEYSDPLAPRTGSLSANPCDFGTGLPKVGGGSTVFQNDTAPWEYFSLNNPKTGAATLLPSTTYYFNISNASCSGSCNIQVTFTKPSGS